MCVSRSMQFVPSGKIVNTFDIYTFILKLEAIISIIGGFCRVSRCKDCMVLLFAVAFVEQDKFERPVHEEV